MVIGAKLYAVNSNGTEKWQLVAVSRFGNDLLSTSPAIGDDGTIYVGGGFLYGVNPNGTQEWSFETQGNLLTSPAVGSDGSVYVGTGYDLYAVNHTNGQHFFDGPNCNGAGAASSPAISDDGQTIYVGFALLCNSLNAMTPTLAPAWAFVTGGMVISSPAIAADGTIYVGSADGALYAIRDGGFQKWKWQGPGTTISSSPVIGADGTIYVGVPSNSLYAINPNGSQKWKFSEPGDVDVTSPAIGADGTIYYTSGVGLLYALGSGGAPPNPTPTATPTATPTPVPGVLNVHPNPMRFGRHRTGTTKTKNVIMQSARSNHLSILLEKFEVSGGDYRLNTGQTTCAQPQMLNPGDQCHVAIDFTPAAPSSNQSDQGSLTITTNAQVVKPPGGIVTLKGRGN